MTNVKKHLTYLETVGLIRLVKTHPELEFMFRHALIQEAAYNSLLLEDRKKLHRQVGEAIEQTYPDQVASRDLAPVLADHFAKAGDDRRALKYFTLAGDAEAAIYANSEAVGHYTHALEIVRKSEVSSEELIHLYIRLGRTLELNSQYDQALSNYQEMGALAHERNDQAMELAALMARSTLYVTFTPIHNPDRGEALSEQALILAQKLEDQEAEARISWNLSNFYLFTGKSASKSLTYGERSLALARQLNLHEQIAFTLNDLGLSYWVNCHLDQAKESLREASNLWRGLDNLPMLADCLSTSSVVWTYTGEYDQAIAFSQEAFQISHSIDNLWGQSYSQHWVGKAHWERGQPDQAISAMEESIRLGELAGFASPQATVRASLANVVGSLGDIERGLKIAQLALTVAENQLPLIRTYALAMLAKLQQLNGNLTEAEATADRAKNDPNREGHPMFFKYVVLAGAELALRQGEYERSLTATEELLTDLRHFGIGVLIPSALHLRGQALLGLGQKQAAHTHLLEARTEAEAIGSRWMLWQILATLAEIETNPTEAETLRQQAKEIIEYIADHTPADLRASFLNLPEVRVVLEGR